MVMYSVRQAGKWKKERDENELVLTLNNDFFLPNRLGCIQDVSMCV